jgi:hypothetical protein
MESQVDARLLRPYSILSILVGHSHYLRHQAGALPAFKLPRPSFRRSRLRHVQPVIPFSLSLAPRYGILSISDTHYHYR